MASESELERALADAGGADAPREWGARLRKLLRAELARGAGEMGEARSGRERPVALAEGPGGGGVAAGAAGGPAAAAASAASRAAAGSWAGARGSVVVALPLPPELRADAGAVAERGATLAAAAVERLVEAPWPGPPPPRPRPPPPPR